MLILVCGLPGAGKSTLARALSEKIGAVYLSSDIIRKKMLNDRTYSENEKYRVYERMVGEAELILASGKTVVCDATFYKGGTRGEMRAAARRTGSEIYIVKCVLDENEVERRMEERERGGNSESEADFRIYLKVKNLFEGIDEEHLEVDTSLPLEKQVHIVETYLEKEAFWKPEELLEGEAYPHSSENLKMKETHISWVFLAGDYAYKLKKPAKFSFLDYSTKEKRREACEEEVRLNRRLSPEIYLGVVPLVKRSGQTRIGGEGREIDYAVKMKRMGQTMDRALEKGEVGRENIEELAETIAKFHNSVPLIQDPAYNSPEMIKEQIDDLESVRGIVEEASGMGEKIGVVLEKSGEFIKKNEGMLKNRQVEGMVRDCHGDLHSKNVFVADKKYVFDCIEFNEDFRFIDVASEIAFMAMDLDYRGKEELSELFVKKYLELSGDTEMPELLDFYKCYRANVRAKVAAIEYGQSKNESKKGEMEKYLVLAEKYANKL
ncbi:MAG: AAA family ATPase [Candidatus Micrarchaeia archaeon]